MSQQPSHIRPRDPSTIGRIAVDADILVGKPRIAGTRISVEAILEEMSAGTSVDELLGAYPQLRREDIQAALAYALQSIRHEEVQPITPESGAAG